MKNLDYFLKSFINAAGVLIYVSCVSWFMFNSQTVFTTPPSFLIPLFMLLLFVVSASITGALVLGKPMHLYMSGFKKEAWLLFFATLAWLFVFLVMIVGILIFLQS